MVWLVLASGFAPAVEVHLASPLNTLIDLVSEFPVGETVLSAQIEVPADAPAGLLVSAFAIDDGGAWRQSHGFTTVSSGRQRVALHIPPKLGTDIRMRAIAGLMFSSIAGTGLTIRISDVQVQPIADSPSRRVFDLAWDATPALTNRPWQVRIRPAAVNGFRLEGRLTDPAGTVTRLEGTAHDVGWSLNFIPHDAGPHHLVVVAHWGEAEEVVHELDIAVALSDLPVTVTPAPQSPPAPSGTQGVGQAFRLSSPLRSCFGTAIRDDLSACRIRARVWLGDDAPEDLTVGVYVRDRMGRWRQGAEPQRMQRGDNRIDLVAPAGLAASDQHQVAQDVAEAGLVGWSAQISQAVLRVADFHVEALSAIANGEAVLDRLRLEEVTYTNAGLTVEVGGTWSASVEPSPDVGGLAGVRCGVSARLTDSNGRVQVVAATVDESGRHRVTCHPSIPGDYTVSLVGAWSDGRRVESPLAHLRVLGAHPCPLGNTIAIQGPLTRIVPLSPEPMRPMGPVGRLNRVEATILVPDGAPDDLSVAVVAIDHDHHWFQQARPQGLHAGINRLTFSIDADADLASEPAGVVWTADSLATFEKTALAFATSSALPVSLIVQGAVARPVSETSTADQRLLGITCSAPTGATGERWSVALRPEPFPANPYDPDDFRLDLLVTTPEGQSLLVPGFYAEDMSASDRGDHEQLQSVAGGFQVRYRPRTPGRHRLELRATWRDGRTVQCKLPQLQVTGATWDGYVRVDRSDPRFFSVDGKFFWPVGPNLRSVWDLRAQERMHTRVTPDRGSLAYAAYLRRFSAAGANACEIWMSAWNLALEWRQDWPGFAGVGRYNQDNAWRLDRILDAAWAEGMRVNLVINNHGQGSDKTDAEWSNNPYNRAAGGKLTAADQLFRDPWALLGQEKLRRYLVARYADHPAVLGWKLWTEMDLTNGGAYLRSWHELAAKRWRELDVYGHPVASHWCGDYTHPDEKIVSLLDYVCIDAYHGDEEKDRYRLVHRLLNDSTTDAEHGLARLGRPVLVTEYGGNWSGTRTDELMIVDHSCGAWVGLVSGHAGAPMLWWFEWVDQGERFGPYGAIRRFVAGEDLRGSGHSITVRAERGGRLWSAAWSTDTRVLGYVIDERWAEDGHTAQPVNAVLVLGADRPAGHLTCEWWDPDQGTIIATQTMLHAGGTLRLNPPPFRKHLAWKIR